MRATPRDRSNDLRLRLKALGLSDAAIAAAWPKWWTHDADDSPSARAELKFGVARRLGLDPGSLLHDEGQPHFIWQEEARFKHLAGEGDVERAGITSFGRAVAAILISASPSSSVSITGTSALEVRAEILRSGRPYVDLLDLLSLAWSVGVPVIHLRVFPWPQKRMAAMTVGLSDRFAVLLAKDAQYPAPIAFYLAHEFGHVALEHVAEDQLIVDLEDDDGRPRTNSDDEERDADAFALELLTGSARPVVLPEGGTRATGRELARIALQVADELQVEPGVLAETFGHSTGDWRTTGAALKLIYEEPKPVWREINAIANRELNLSELTDDESDFIEAILG